MTKKNYRRDQKNFKNSYNDDRKIFLIPISQPIVKLSISQILCK